MTRTVPPPLPPIIFERDELCRVMEDDPPLTDVGQLVPLVRGYRKEYHLIEDVDNTSIPPRLLRLIEDFGNKCLANEDFCNQWMCVNDNEYGDFVLKESELHGSMYPNDRVKATVIDDRKVIGKNIDPNECAWMNRASIVFKTDDMGGVIEKVYSMIPKSLFPRRDDTEESLRKRIANCKSLDLIFNHFENKCLLSLNETITSRQPCRRTSSVVSQGARFFESTLQEGEEEGSGEVVVSMYSYPNTECPTNLWMNYPMYKIEYAMMLKIWSLCWSGLSIVSRERPPTGCQLLVYHHLLMKNMGPHRDNYRQNVMVNLVNGVEPPWGDGATVGGSANSQARGSSVIVFTRGKPMKITLRYVPIGGRVATETKNYTTSPSFQMRLGDGYISVLDPIDDMLMTHSVEWVEEEMSEDGVRFAWVYRWLTETNDYYENCRVRRTKGMMKTKVREIDESNPLYHRSIFSKMGDEEDLEAVEGD